MSFTAPLFLVFCVGVFGLYIAIGDRRRWQLRLITLASIVFYASFDWRFVPLLLGTCLVDFYCAIQMSRAQAAGRTGKRWLLLSLISNLSMLGFFKYVNFFLGGAHQMSTWLGFSPSDWHVDVVLPLGISFYTFQSLSYTIDVYRKTTHARQNPATFLAGLSFFPHLLAGPIVRGQRLISMFEHGPVITKARLHQGIVLVGLGLAKKTIADMVGAVANDYFAVIGTGDATLLDAWVGVLSFTAQAYGDFAGYSDIAIGLALIFGYDFPTNFNLPYLSSSPAEFWRRWHITLSTWLRDYLFIPLMRTGRFNLFVCFMITMGLAGLWHGASWNCVVYGLYHGVLLYLTSVIAGRFGDLLDNRWAHALGIVLTFNLIVIGFVIFRAGPLSHSVHIVRAMYAGATPSPEWNSLIDLALAISALVSCHVMDWFYLRRREILLKPYVLVPVLIACFVMTFAMGAPQQFIYFQF